MEMRLSHSNSKNMRSSFWNFVPNSQKISPQLIDHRNCCQLSSIDDRRQFIHLASTVVYNMMDVTQHGAWVLLQANCSVGGLLVDLNLCLLGATVNSVKTADTIEMPFGLVSVVGPKYNVLDGRFRTLTERDNFGRHA